MEEDECEFVVIEICGSSYNLNVRSRMMNSLHSYIKYRDKIDTCWASLPHTPLSHH